MNEVIREFKDHIGKWRTVMSRKGKIQKKQLNGQFKLEKSQLPLPLPLPSEISSDFNFPHPLPEVAVFRITFLDHCSAVWISLNFVSVKNYSK